MQVKIRTLPDSCSLDYVPVNYVPKPPMEVTVCYDLRDPQFPCLVLLLLEEALHFPPHQKRHTDRHKCNTSSGQKRNEQPPHSILGAYCGTLNGIISFQNRSLIRETATIEVAKERLRHRG
eukprot:COSAG02_NODE_6203_length_3732_cov_1.726122_3_plen_120_part_01